MKNKILIGVIGTLVCLSGHAEDSSYLKAVKYTQDIVAMLDYLGVGDDVPLILKVEQIQSIDCKCGEL